MPDARFNVLVDGERLDPRVLSLLGRLEIRESDSAPAVAVLRLSLRQLPDGRFTPIDDSTFDPVTSIAIEVEAPGGLPVTLFNGFVTHIRPHYEEIEANCYVEILAADHATILQAEERIAAYPDATDSEAVEQVFRRYRLPVRVEDTPARYTEDEHLLVQRGSDWAFVQMLAARNGFVCYLEPDEGTGDITAHFASPAFDADPQADLLTQMPGANLRWLDLQFSASGPVRHVASSIEPLGKRVVRADGAARLTDLGAESAKDTVEPALTAVGVGAATALLDEPLPMGPALEAQSSGISDSDRLVIEGRGELDPSAYRGLLRARRPVLLRGVGETFSGIYYVRTVRTILDEGAISQTFTMVRNAIRVEGREEFGQSAEEVGPQ